MEIIDVEMGHVRSEDGASTSIEKEDVRPLTNSIRKMFKNLEPPWTSECCIYRVRGSLRNINEAAYTPRVISIGPFHRGKKELQTMEKHKERYLYYFLQRTKTSLEDMITSIKEWEERVRGCYAKIIELSSDELVKMILLDGGFIIECFLRSNSNGSDDENREALYNPWLETDILYDLILLENQLPFFVLEKLYSQIDDQENSFLSIACDYFSEFNKQKISLREDQKVKHFTDLLRTFHLPSSPASPPEANEMELPEAGVKCNFSLKHFTDLLRTFHLHSSPASPPEANEMESAEANEMELPDQAGVNFSLSAMELHEAGVKFKVNASQCLFNIQFTNGALQIPNFVIEDGIESLFRNLMALEQCYYPHHTHICKYIDLMDTLINTAKDVELLVQKGIIDNGLGGNDSVAILFNNLCLEITFDGLGGYFSKLRNDLTEYYKNRWHNWRATLKRDYFSTPWRIASTFAAVILLVLTFMQTVNSFISL